MTTQNPSSHSPARRSFLRRIPLWVKAVIVGTSGIILFVVAVFQGADTKLGEKLQNQIRGLASVAIVGPDNGDDSNVWVPMRARIVADTALLTERGAKVMFINDPGTPMTARRNAERLCADKSVTMVIGYVSTTPANAALDVYRSAECRMPVIFIAATGTVLTRFNETRWTTPVLQMAPSNWPEADQLAEGFTDTFGVNDVCRVLMLKDAANPGYADDLAPLIEGAIDAKRKATCIITTKTYGSGGPDYRALVPRGKYDAIVWVGMAKNAKALFARRPMSPSEPPVIVTDGTVTEDFLELGDRARCVWGIFPRRPDDGSTEIPGVVPSWPEFGHDAMLLASEILADTSDELSRAHVAQMLRHYAQDAVSVRVRERVQYEWNKIGGVERISSGPSDRAATAYHFFQVQYSAMKRGWIWHHRERRISLRECQAVRPL